MPVAVKKEKVLVISSETTVGNLVREAVGDSIDVINLPTRDRALETIRKEMPSMIVLGYSEPQGSAFQLYSRLKEGWATKNTPLLIIETQTQGTTKPTLSPEEKLKVDVNEFLMLPGTSDGKVMKESILAHLKEQENVFKEALLDPNVFCVTWEQIPGKGAFEPQQEEVVENARKVALKGKIHAVSVTDNPSGNPAISAGILCTEIKRMGVEPLVHLAFRDRNRNQVEGLLYGLAASDVRSILMLSGDYPSDTGFQGRGKPVFDFDSVHGLELAEAMNKGLPSESMGKKTILAPTDFFAGAAISPFKQVEAELMGQYFKLKKKIEAGAKFLITQVGYDARKFHELATWMKVNNHTTPLLANIYILPYGAGRAMNANQIPGCVVTDKLLAKLDEERNAKDKGKQTRLDRAAKMYAFAKGMGYRGAHIGGHGATYDMIEYIVNKGEEFAPKWQELVAEFDFPQKDGFYLFEKDGKTGLNTEKPASRNAKGAHPPVYELSRMAHATIFNPDSVVFKSLRPLARGIDGTHIPKHIFKDCEHMAKVVLFDCQNCGDCGLFDVAFLCPVSQCPKNQRNGPCGGSHEGWCEVYPNERKCIWVRAYDRLKAHKEEHTIGEYICPPNEWALNNTSSWLNFYMGRDHSAKRLGVKPPEPKKKAETPAPKAEKAPAPPVKEPPK